MSPRRKTSMLTLQFVPYTDISSLQSKDRIDKLIKIVKENKIILLEGRLKAQEEAELIRRTMEEIDDKFKGIEISPFITGAKNDAFTKKIKQMLLKVLLGNRQGFTIIGPATIVKEIKQDPEKIQLLTEEQKRR